MDRISDGQNVHWHWYTPLSLHHNPLHLEASSTSCTNILDGTSLCHTTIVTDVKMHPEVIGQPQKGPEFRKSENLRPSDPQLWGCSDHPWSPNTFWLTKSVFSCPNMYLFLQIRIGKQNIQTVIIFVKRLSIWMISNAAASNNVRKTIWRWCT